MLSPNKAVSILKVKKVIDMGDFRSLKVSMTVLQIKKKSVD